METKTNAESSGFGVENEEDVFTAPSSVQWNAKTFSILQAGMKRRYGDDLVLVNGTENLPAFDFVPSGDPCLDSLLGGFAEKAGWPRASFIEISGEESSGKTSLCYEALAAFAKAFPDRGIAFIDKEANFDKEYAEHLGVPVNENRFVYIMPEDGPQALNILSQLVKTGMFSCIVLDSWASLNPIDNEEKDTNITDQQIGWLAKAGANALGKLANAWKKYDCTFITTNQLRVNLTPMGARGMITTGANAMKYYPRLKLRIKSVPGEGKEDLRKVIVNKAQGAARTESEVEVAIKHGIGLDRIESLIVIALSEKQLIASGAWLKIPTLGVNVQGRNNLAELLRSDNEIRNKLCELLKVSCFEARYPLKRKLRLTGDGLLPERQEEN